MKCRNFIISTITFLGLYSNILAQLSINYPLNNAVYQRNLQNLATVNVGGSILDPNITSVEARVINLSSGNPIAGFDWKVIHILPIGSYSGKLVNVPAGWYTLEVRSKRNNTVISSSTVNRFGIGDVFSIAGQSNAQGYIYNQYLGANDPRVVTHNNGMYCSVAPIPFPVMTQLTGQVKPGLNGRDSWCYGRLGDLLVGSTGYPVSFFNAAASGSGILNWKQSAQNQATLHAISNEPYCSTTEENTDNPNYIPGNKSTYEEMSPYQNFLKTLNYYNSFFGARAILWHQGESDNIKNTSTETYSNDLNFVINKSRQDFGSNLPWVIARASYMPWFNASSKIINAQNNVINVANNIFPGPPTDDITNSTMPGSRGDDGIHFAAPNGLGEVAQRWANFLNPSFFNEADPSSATDPPIIKAVLIDNIVKLELATSFATYRWIRSDISPYSNIANPSVGSSNSITVSEGKYRCWVTYADGKQQISAEINVNEYLKNAKNEQAISSNIKLENLNFYEAQNSAGPIEFNKSNGTETDGDGSPIRIRASNYANGIGVSAPSSISYKIPKNRYFRLKTGIGVNDSEPNCNGDDGLVFRIYTKETLLFQSAIINKTLPYVEIDIPINNYEDLRFTVESTNGVCKNGIWVNPILTLVGIDLGFKANDDVLKGFIPGASVKKSIINNDILSDGLAATANLVIIDLDLSLNGIQNQLLVQNEGTWSYEPNDGKVSFVPVPNFKRDPTPIQYEITELFSNKKGIAVIQILYNPIAVNDKVGFAIVERKEINILANDNVNKALVPVTIKIKGTNGAGQSLTVTNEGQWQVSGGKLIFIPETGFSGIPSPVYYTGLDADSLESNEAMVSFDNHPPISKDDYASFAYNNTKTVNVLENDLDGDPPVANTLMILDPINGIFVDSILVPFEGIWKTNTSTGSISFKPLPTYIGSSPTPIYYVVSDLEGTMSNLASVNLVTSLNVDLSGFKVVKNNYMSKLNWLAKNEKGFDFFEILKSKDLKEFYPIGVKNWVGEGYYTFFDKENLKGDNFYQLKMVDKDGTFKYSKMIHLFFEESTFHVYPNPIQVPKFELKCEIDILKVESINSIGQNESLFFTKTDHMYTVFLNPQLAPGLHFVKITFLNQTGLQSSVVEKILYIKD